MATLQKESFAVSAMKPTNDWGELFARVSNLEEGPPALLSRIHAAACSARSAVYGLGTSDHEEALGSAAAAAAAAGAKGYGYDLSESLLPAAAPSVSFGLRDGLAASLTRYTRECRRLRSHGLLFDGVSLSDTPAAGAVGAAAAAAAAEGQEGQQQHERFVGLEGSSSGVDVAAFRGLRRLYQSVAAEARSAAEASQQQLLAAIDMERDLKCWAAAKASLMQQLALPPAAAGALAFAGSSNEGHHLGELGSPQTLQPHPLLTDPEQQLLFALPSMQQLQQQQEGRGLALLLQQLPAAAAAAAAAAAVEPERPSAERTQAVCLPPSPIDSWGVWTPEQQQHCSNWLRLVLGMLRCVETWRQGSSLKERGYLLRLLVGNAIAALEEDRRLAAGAPDVLLHAATSAAAARGAGENLCCSVDLALPWLQLAAVEETGGEASDCSFGSLWWPAVYLAFRSGDILCLLCLGAGPFLPPGCCSFADAASAAIAAAAADPSAAAQQQEQQQQSVCFREFGVYPSTLPFVCRQLVVLLQRTSLEAVRRNAADKEGIKAANALEAFVAAIPNASALAPEATTARGWSDCFVLHPPSQQQQQQQQQQEEQHRQQDACRDGDSHLLLLLSLLRPDLWPPLKLSDTLHQVTQEDFLHYKLVSLLAQAQQQPQQQAEASLLRGLRTLVSKVKLQGPLFFDPQQQQQQQQQGVAPVDGDWQQQQHGWTDPQKRIAAALHANFTYAWLLTLCGGLIDALLWLLNTYPFLRRVAMLLLLLCYKFGWFESASLLHLSSDALHEALETACGAAANAGVFGAEAPKAAAANACPWTDEAWALEWQERGTPSDGPLADFLAQDLAAAIGSTFGCTDTSFARLANRLIFAGSPGELRYGARSQLKAVLLSAIDSGLSGLDPLTQIAILSLLPLFWSVPLLPATIREAFAALTKPGILVGDSDAAEGDMPPGLLESLLLREQPQQQQQLRRPQQRFLADLHCSSSRNSSSSMQRVLQHRLEEELWGSYFILLDSDSSGSRSGSPWAAFDCEANAGGSRSGTDELLLRRQQLEERPFFVFLYSALRHEARRRGDLRSAFAAAWLVTDERNAADALAEALSSQLFSDFALEANHQRRDLRAFFLRAFNVLKRSTAKVPRKLDLLAARGLFLSLLSSERFFEAMHAFNNMQLQLRLLPDKREEIPAYLAASYDAQLVAELLDALVFLLQQLLAQGYLLENLLPFERLLTFQLLATEHLTAADSPHIEATKSVLTQLATRYRS